jgi:hypothetical protein
VTEERDILKKAAAYFAKESGLSTPSSVSSGGIPSGYCARLAKPEGQQSDQQHDSRWQAGAIQKALRKLAIENSNCPE